MALKFVSHSHKDNDLVRPFVEDLRNAGLELWVDLEQITHDDFVKRMNEGLAQSEWVILVQTPNSLPNTSKAVESEINAALNLKFQGKIRDVIPFIMAECQPDAIPPLWANLHHYDAVHDGYQAALTGLLNALGVTSGPRTVSPYLLARLPGTQRQDRNQNSSPPPPALPPQPPRPPTPQPNTLPPDRLPTRLAQLGFVGQTLAVNGRSLEVILPPLCHVEAGPFWMGSQFDPQAGTDEPWHQVTLGAYAIGMYPVTIAEYACAVRAGSVPRPSGWARQQARGLDHPVVNIRWRNAVAYVAWLAQVTGEPWRLPTEAEWEKAARWDAAREVSRIYPWGDTWDARRANIDEGIGTLLSSMVMGGKLLSSMVMGARTTAVGNFAAAGDASPYGCHDMAGNVWEWTSSIYVAEAYQPDSKRENNSDISSPRVLRGGSWYNVSRLARAAYRVGYNVDFGYYCGFRLVRGVGAGSH